MNYKLENVGDKLNSEQSSSVVTVREFCVGTVPAAGADLEAPRKYRNSYLIKICKPARQSSGNVMRIILDRKLSHINPYPTAFPYGNGMVLHFYQQQESSTTKTVHKVINKRLKAYV